MTEDTSAEIVIVGGGITGITTAYLLTKENKDVVLLEGSQLLNGTTGHTTAKITAQHDLIYDELIQHFGKEKASLYYQANDEALRFVRGTASQNQIDCNMETEDACIYAQTDEYKDKLDKEYAAYQEIGIPCEYKDDVPFEAEVKKALYMKDQSRFHPLKYLSFMVDEILKNGGRIYEHTVAIDIEEEPQLSVRTKQGHKVACDKIISCSHFPFCDKLGFYFARMYAERSYVVAIEPKKPLTAGMYLSVDEPVRSIRKAAYDGEEVLLISGESHRTGEGVDTSFHYRALEEFAAETFGIKNKVAQWSAQDLFTLDKVPYIGKATKNNENILIATGYKKWGMTSGTVAALLLRDLATGKNNRYEKLFTPSRFQADPSLKKFLSNNFNVASHLIEGKLELVGTRPESLEKGQGDIVEINGKRAGAYKDEKGKLHIVDTTCTHMGCEVDWNSAEHTWDCPCHGSRFSINGEVIEGPAKNPLRCIKMDEDTAQPVDDKDQEEKPDTPEPV
nr:FAD-dependent oxidoreductase [Thalassobacillus pellis]